MASMFLSYCHKVFSSEFISSTMIIVSAIKEEVNNLKHPILLTGVGKINATLKLTKYILEHRPNLVVNYGTAGSIIHKPGKIIEIGKFIQKDMNVTELGFKDYQTPNEESIISNGKSYYICGTADTFDTNITKEFDCVDMEAYSIAKVCKFFNVPYRVFKYISDSGDGKEWENNLLEGQEKFRLEILPKL